MDSQLERQLTIAKQLSKLRAERDQFMREHPEGDAMGLDVQIGALEAEHAEWLAKQEKLRPKPR